jgi:DNA invertase Pin-like site-specific DNA recombinase
VPIKRKLSIVDPKTGQVVEADAVVYYGKAKRDKNFIKLLHTFIKDAVRDRELRPALDLLAYIMSEKLEKDSLKFYLTAEEVVKNLGVSRDTYYRWLRTLMKKGYITRIATNYYVLNP